MKKFLTVVTILTGAHLALMGQQDINTELEPQGYGFAEKNTHIDSKDTNGFTRLHWASNDGELDDVKELIAQGASLNALNQYGETPLHRAAFSTGNLDTVKYLVDNGADVKAKDELGRTPLHHAAKRKDPSIAKYLVVKGADVEARADNGSPLHWAVNAHNLDILPYLVEEAGADINAQDEHGNTPLFRAIIMGNSDVVKYLKEKGADLNAKEKLSLQDWLHKLELISNSENFDTKERLIIERDINLLKHHLDEEEMLKVTTDPNTIRIN